MNHKLGVHWIKTHGRPEDIEYIRRLQPLSIKLVAGDVPDVQWISDTHQAAPNALIVLRSHAMSEQKSDMATDPVFTGKRHAQEWNIHVERLRSEARRRKLPFPDNDRLVVLGINEPEVWNHLQQTVEYTVAFLDSCQRMGLIAGALNLSVGWPANTGADTPPNWTPYESVRAAVIRGRHYLFLHEYHDIAGPSEQWGWWCGRYEKCPWPDVRIIIGEYGIDRFVKDGNIHLERRGWRGWLSADLYAAQIRQYHESLLKDKRIHSAQIYTSDYSHPWSSMDLLDLYPQLLAYADEVRSRVVIGPPPTAPTWTGYITATNGLNLRTEPNTSANVVTTIALGEQVVITDRRGDWLAATYGALSGWVSAQWVSEQKPAIGGGSTDDQRNAIIAKLAAEYGVDERLAKAVIKIESGGAGFRNGRLIMRFEPHVFKAQLKELFEQHFEIGNPAWDGEQHQMRFAGGDWGSFHGNQDEEYEALDLAQLLAKEAALRSASYGAGQILGINYASVGYRSAEEMKTAFEKSEEAQIRAMFEYFRNRGLIEKLKAGDLLGFASGYNGPANAAHYEKLIREAMR